jgi:hypothetical protein
MSTLKDQLAQRTGPIEERFQQAVTLELRCQVAHEIELRGRGKSNFFADFTSKGATIFRGRWEEATAKSVATLWQKLTDLRTYYAGQHDSAVEGLSGFLKLMNEAIPEETKKILNTVFVPADFEDYEGIPNKYKIEYTPSTVVQFAWQEIRDFDTAFMQLDAAEQSKRTTPPPTFEIRFCLPEAIAPPPDAS